MQRRALLGGIAVGSVAVLAGCSASLFGDPVEESRTLEFDPGDDAAVSVRSGNGDVSVETHGGDGVVVEAAVSAPTEERLADVTVEGDARDDAFHVEVRVAGDTSRVRADLDVRVPEGAELASVQSENGDVDVREVAAVSTARSQNGDVTVGDTGPVESVGAENGDVEADVPAPLPGDVTVQSENGDVDARLSPDVDAELAATTQNGDVEVRDLELADREESESEPGVRGVLGSGTNLVSVASVNGDVTVERLA